MMKRHQLSCQFTRLLVIAVMLISLAACSKRYSEVPTFWPFPFRDYENQSTGRFKTSYLAKQIDEYYNGINPGPIGVTTFVNLDELNTTSSFGRVCGEQIMSELSMLGYDVIELRHADALNFLSENGEFALSRDIASVRRERDLGGIVVGTYVVSPVRVYLNARLVDPATSRVLSAGSVEMKKTKEITKLVRGGSFSPTLERIPVKRLGIQTYHAPWATHGRYWDMEEMGYARPPMPAAPMHVAPKMPGMSDEKMSEGKKGQPHMMK